jgi:hypothetical protein
VVGVGVTVGDGVTVGVGEGWEMLLVRPVRHVTVAPPPFPEPTHWLTDTTMSGVVVEFELTVHCTRCVPPPPFPELLHWVTLAPLVVAGNGLQRTVGAVPPPSPDVLHWLTVAEVGVTVAVMLLMTSTVHTTVPPPPFPEPLHCVTEVTMSVDGVVDELQTIVGGSFANPWHAWRTTVELVTLPLRLFVTV